MKLKVTVWLLAFIVLSSVTAWAGLTKTEVSQLYVSIFGRASEGEGNAYWQAHSDMANAADVMLDTDAAKNYFGANLNTNQAFIEHIYLNTLNKTIADDFDGINYWVGMLDAGTSRGQAVASLVGVIKEYAPGAQYCDPNDTATVAAYNQFMNRVEVSNYMADNVYDTPADWETATSFSDGLVVTGDPATAYTAMVIVNGFTDELVLPGPCGAYVAPGVWKEFDCYNLASVGKRDGDDPFTPSWKLIGGYWQWGRKGPDPSNWYSTNTEHFAHGPSGPGESEANDGGISNWDDDFAPDGSWSDSHKTANDPCPEGFRIPTESQWEGVLYNNTQSTVGTWTEDDTNYSSALFLGSDLMLPAAGRRSYSYSGALYDRGNFSFYWSSSESEYNNNFAGTINFNGITANLNIINRRSGRSIRCVADEATACTYNISPSSSSFTSSGGTASVLVSTSMSECNWTTLNSLPWVALSPTSWTGSGNVIVTVTANSGAARTGSVTIAGKTYSISQAAPVQEVCSNIAGTWYSSETVTITCNYGGESERDKISESGNITIFQNECNIWYNLDYGFGTVTRTGTINGNIINFTGPFLIFYGLDLDALGCTVNKNITDITGVVNGNTITLEGSGNANGTCDGIVASCVGSSTATFHR